MTATILIFAVAAALTVFGFRLTRRLSMGATVGGGAMIVLGALLAVVGLTSLARSAGLL